MKWTSSFYVTVVLIYCIARSAKQGADRKLNSNSTREWIMIIYLLFPLLPFSSPKHDFPSTQSADNVVEPP